MVNASTISVMQTYARTHVVADRVSPRVILPPPPR
jgi:hypothetical protein